MCRCSPNQRLRAASCMSTQRLWWGSVQAKTIYSYRPPDLNSQRSLVQAQADSSRVQAKSTTALPPTCPTLLQRSLLPAAQMRRREIPGQRKVRLPWLA